MDNRENFKTDKNIAIARKFGKEFFDGSRAGYGSLAIILDIGRGS